MMDLKETTMGPVELAEFDVIVVNTSAGKDSQAMMDVIVRRAREEGVLDRVVAVHADLGRVEWKGTRELAEKQANAYGIRFEVVKRAQGDLLEHVRDRKKWPSSTARYCTSDHKRGQVARIFTKLVAEAREAGITDRPVRILNAMGIRAAESPARKKKVPYQRDERASNGKRDVWTWYPIFTWTEAQVWETIQRSGVPHHPAYDLGMPRLSCVFCVFAPKAALLVAGKHNPELLAEYVEVEQEIGHTFRKDFSLVELAEALERGEEPGEIKTWEM
jgi:3'-phosphoadenosine 5'-phosphosulfate sulfotransferase (PAPS reductase)/FAD synthetase